MNMNAIPEDAIKALQLLGSNLKVARTRRKETQIQFAARMGVERETVSAMEQGSPRVSMGVYAMALWVIGMTEDLGEIAHPDRDIQGKVAERESAPERIRQRPSDLDQYNF